MKKLITAISIAICILSGCQEELSEGRIDNDHYFATAEKFGAAAKTVLSGANSVVWSEGDRIAIYEGSDVGRAYQVLGSHAGSSSGEFEPVEGVMTEGKGDSFNGTVAVYPFCEDLTLTNTENDSYDISGIVFPSEQTYTPESFDNGSFPMAAVLTDNGKNLSFKNIGGAIKLQLKGSGKIRTISLKGNNNETLAGTAKATVSSSSVPTVELTSDIKEVILDCGPEGAALSTTISTDFIISLPPTVFSEGFTVTITDMEGNTTEHSTSKKIIVARSSILKMPAIMVNSGEDIPEELVESIQLNDGVISYGEEMNDYFTIVDEYTLHISSDIDEDLVPAEGALLIYDSSDPAIGTFVGRVLSVEADNTGWTVTTEMPSIDEIFKELTTSVRMDASNTVAVLEESDADGSISSCQVVDNSVWDGLQVIYAEEGEWDAETRAGAETAENINITLELASEAKDVFEGKVYLGLKGNIKFYSTTRYEMDLNVRVGLSGTLGVGVEEEIEKTIPILKELKKGITLYNNKIIAVRMVPELAFFTEGKIHLEAGMNFEIMNTGIKSVYSDGEFYQSHIEHLHDNYFRVHSLHSEGVFGLKLTGRVYAFLFNEKFMNAGVSISAGIGIQGESNIGIQFPDLANFDCSVSFKPFLEMYPFIAYRSIGGLKMLEGPKLTVSTDRFTKDLLPNIHEMNYKRRSEQHQLSVEGSIKSQNTSFIESKQEGVALFIKGDVDPIAHQTVSRTATKASLGNLTFDISNSEEYEIAPYVESMYDGFVYGERQSIESPLRAQLEELYRTTNGDEWYNNENWCTDAPLDEWYGIYYTYYEEEGYSIYLSGNNLNGYITLNSSELIEISCTDNQLTSLNLSGCTALESVDCRDNQLTSLDLSAHTALESVDCRDNPLQTIDLSGCTDLKDFYFPGHKDNDVKTLSSLDVSGCSSLEVLWVDNNKISEMNISGCTSLRDIHCLDNQLTSLNLSGCTALESVYCRDNQLTSLDLSAHTALESVDCNGNPLQTIDLSGCTDLKEFHFHAYHYNDNDVKTLSSLDVSGCSSLEVLWVDNNKISEMNISECTSLRDIECNYNQLTSLDLSRCTALVSVDCRDNQLTSLDLSAHTALESIDCCDNQLTSLDLSAHTALESVDCNGNPLQTIDLSGCTDLKKFHFHAYHYNDVKTLSSLDVSGCSSLEVLWVDNNKISEMNISGCTSLRDIECNDNQLTSLDLSAHTALESIDCCDNQLTSLDLSAHTALESVDCNGNPLQTIDLSGCTDLKKFHFHAYHYNDVKTLSSLDVSGCSSLEVLWVDNNKISEMNISGCTSLRDIECNDNQLTSISISGLPNLTRLICHTNKITQQITPEYERLDPFKYDERYTGYRHRWLYDDEGNRTGCDFGYTDNKIGWWYPGEPESRHSDYH